MAQITALSCLKMRDTSGIAAVHAYYRFLSDVPSQRLLSGERKVGFGFGCAPCIRRAAKRFVPLGVGLWSGQARTLVGAMGQAALRSEPVDQPVTRFEIKGVRRLVDSARSTHF